MRCPKCGYTTFDHLESCPKCKKNIQSAASSLQGAIYNVDLPQFLKLNPTWEDEEAEEISLQEDGAVDHDDVVDKDLNVLMESEEFDEDDEIGISNDDGPVLRLQGDEPEDTEESGEIEIDFGKFEDDFKEEEITLTADDEPVVQKLDIPDELIDMSDLEPPALERVETAPGSPAMAKPAQDNDDFDEDLDSLDIDLDLDLDLDLGSAGKDPKPASPEAVLSLDDLDFSEDLPSGGTPKEKGGNLDMDGDLDFELDLGGLSIHKDV